MYERAMDTILAHRGRKVTSSDVHQIRELIAAHPEASRRALSVKLCEAWGWFQANGKTRDMVCRSLMLELHRGGHIELPPVRCNPPNPLAKRARPAPVEVDRTPISSTLKELGPLVIRQVRRSAEESLLGSLIEMHHYLGYTQPVGEHLKHMVFAGIGRWLVLRGARRRAISRRATVSLAGRRKRARPTSVSWPTTVAS